MEVEVLFFSGEVSVRCRKEFAGSEDADPKFIDLVPDQTTWDDYCAAFAAGGCLMARQSLMWTALPNGYSADGTSLRLSVLLSPRLEPQAQPKALSSFFPDWEDWPATLEHGDLHDRVEQWRQCLRTADADHRPEPRRRRRDGAADSAAWKALCSRQPVRAAYEYRISPTIRCCRSTRWHWPRRSAGCTAASPLPRPTTCRRCRKSSTMHDGIGWRRPWRPSIARGPMRARACAARIISSSAFRRRG